MKVQIKSNLVNIGLKISPINDITWKRAFQYSLLKTGYYSTVCNRIVLSVFRYDLTG